MDPVRPAASGVRSPKPRRAWPLLVGPGAVLGLGILLAVIWGRHREAPARHEDMPAAPSSPYRNTLPAVKYVGDEACAQCHLDQAEAFRQHPMGRSLAPVAQAQSVERYDAAAHNPFEQLGFHFASERRGREMVHKAERPDGQGRVVIQAATPVQFVIGSGTHGRSYLIDDEDRGRDLAVALCLAARQPGPDRESAARVALPLLEKALARAPADPVAWEAQGMALSFRGQAEQALAAFENALRQAPEREVSLLLACQLAERMGRREAALDYSRRLRHINPWMVEYQHTLARLLADMGDWPAALEACEAAVRLNPCHEPARVLFISCLLRAGQHDRAAKELQTLVRLNPKDEQVLRDWFAAQKQGR